MSILERLRGGCTSDSPEATMDLAREIAAALPPDAVLTLSGDLGAGKTTFVKGLATAWGITRTVTSPTYNIFTLYESPARQLAHMDAYRLAGPEAVDALMLEEFLRSPYCLVIEWPEKIAGWLPSDAIQLRFESSGENSRHLCRID